MCASTIYPTSLCIVANLILRRHKEILYMKESGGQKPKWLNLPYHAGKRVNEKCKK